MPEIQSLGDLIKHTNPDKAALRAQRKELKHFDKSQDRDRTERIKEQELLIEANFLKTEPGKYYEPEDLEELFGIYFTEGLIEKARSKGVLITRNLKGRYVVSEMEN